MLHFNRNNGFTLIEIVIVVMIVTMIGGAVWVLQRNLFSMDRILQGTLAAHGEVQRVFRQLTGEARSLQVSAQGAYPIEYASSEEFIFFRDITNDGITERVRYTLEGGNLEKGVTAASGDPLEYDLGEENVTVVVRNLSTGQEPMFRYFGEDGEELSEPVAPGDIRSLSVFIDANRDNPITGYPVTMETHITPRNIREVR